MLEKERRRIDRVRPGLATALEAAEWPGVAADVRDGRSLTGIARGLRELGEEDSWAHYAVTAIADDLRLGDLEYPEPIHLQYEPWRHGGWYVTNVCYPSGAVGCVSRNYPDRKWRIACDSRKGDYTYASREAAARAERGLIAAGILGADDDPSPSAAERELTELASECDYEDDADDAALVAYKDALERRLVQAREEAEPRRVRL